MVFWVSQNTTKEGLQKLLPTKQHLAAFAGLQSSRTPLILSFVSMWPTRSSWPIGRVRSTYWYIESRDAFFFFLFSGCPKSWSVIWYLHPSSSWTTFAMGFPGPCEEIHAKYVWISFPANPIFSFGELLLRTFFLFPQIALFFVVFLLNQKKIEASHVF